VCTVTDEVETESIEHSQVLPPEQTQVGVALNVLPAILKLQKPVIV
jgi:hypothetical protein